MANSDINQLPNFKNVNYVELGKEISVAIDSALELINNITTTIKTPTWENLVEAQHDTLDLLERKWSVLSHLNNVANEDVLREVYNSCLPKLTGFGTAVSQNKQLNDLYLKLKSSEEYNKLNQGQKRVIDNAIRDFKLGGVALIGDDKAKYAKLREELSALSSKFSENVLDATNTWSLQVKNKDELTGMLAQDIELAAKKAKDKGLEGWLITLDAPSYISVLTYADSERLRYRLHYAYNTKASEIDADGRFDNTKLIGEIVAKETELSKLLEFSNYAEYSLSTKMVKNTEEITSFLEDLVNRSKELAKKEFDDLQLFANNEYGVESLNAWDIAYYSEKLRKENYAISDEELRVYFPAPKVVEGMFVVCNKLYGLNIKRVENELVWHKDITFYEVYDKSGALRGKFYLDLYTRPNKRGGAWMDTSVSRRLVNGEVQHPVAFINTNFAPPSQDKPSLLTHNDVETLFHEFGHGLHHMLTKVDYPGISGIDGVPWDAVELPSQFFENWCWQQESLAIFAKHYETGKSFPDEMFKRLEASKNYHAAMQLARQLEFALFDFQLYKNFETIGEDGVRDLLNEIRDRIAVIPRVDYSRFENSFSHIFAGGYAAGYYSYLWAEVLAQDAFSKFEENGIFDSGTGQSFMENILEKGGSENIQDLYIAFRGRKQSIDPLLRSKNLIK